MIDSRTTEQSSRYDHLEEMTTEALLGAINTEDRTVPVAVAGAIPQIGRLVDGIVEKIGRAHV